MKKRHKRFLKKLLAVSAIAVMLVNFFPFGSVFAAEKDSLADVNLLQNVAMTAALTNNDVKAPGPYDLKLTLTGNNLLDLEAVGPQKSAVFYNKDVAQKWCVEKGATAHVKVNMLPISLNDLPPGVLTTLGGVDTLLGGLTTTVTDITTELVDTVHALLDNLLGADLVNVEGVTELTNTFNGLTDSLLTDLLTALNGVLVYEDDLTFGIGKDGQVIVTYSDGLGKRLEKIVNDVVLNLVSELKNDINALGVDVNLDQLGNTQVQLPLVSDLLELIGKTLDALLGGTLDAILGEGGILDLVIANLLEEVTGLVAGITDTVLKALDELAALQVLGKTTIEVPLKVVKPSGLNGDYLIHGILANTSAVDLALLGNYETFAKVTFNEPATTPGDNGGGTTLPKTSAGLWTLGMASFGTLLAGVGTRLYARKRE